MKRHAGVSRQAPDPVCQARVWAHVWRAPGSSGLQPLSHHFLASPEGRSVMKTSPQLIKEALCVWRVRFRLILSIPVSQLALLYLPWPVMAKLSPSLGPQIDLFLHSHHYCLGGDPLASATHCSSAFSLPLSRPVYTRLWNFLKYHASHVTRGLKSHNSPLLPSG